MNLQTLDFLQIKDNKDLFLNDGQSENIKLFSAALEKFTGSFVNWSNVTFIYYSPSGRQISVVGEACQCGQFTNSADEKFGAGKHFLQKVDYEGEDLGSVALCCLRTIPQAAETLEKLVDLAKGELARIEDETALLAELSASWESLQAVYDLNADFSSSQNPKSLLKKITERTTAISGKISSVLWLENDEKLEPVAARCRFDLKPRDKNRGLLGKVFTKKSSLIYNNLAPAEKTKDLEFEFKNAFRLAIIPLTTQLATYGVLAVWLEFEDFMFDSRTMRLLDTLALQAAMVIENDRLHRESIRNERLNQEIEIGSKIQQTLLSGNPPSGLKGITFAAETISSQQIDGDFYDFIEHGEDCFDMIIGDVMGKGIPAALVGAAAKNSFLRAIGQLQSSEQNLRPSPEKIVTWVNSEVTTKLIQFESFVTACYARFDLAKRQITFVDCGHTKTIHYHDRTGEITLLEGDNMPLGFSEREIFSEKTIQTEPGDLLFFYSDGVNETRNPQNELFGDKRLSEFIRQNAQSEPKIIIASLLETLKEFSTEKNFNDDLTCVAVRIGSKPAEKQGTVMGLLLNSNLQELERVRRFVSEVARIFPGKLPVKESIDQMTVAVTEAFANIIEHGYKGESGKKIELAAESFANGIQIALHHWGESFNPSTVPPPIFDGSVDRGFGLFIISSCVDLVRYATDPENRHTILLIKNSKK